MRRGRTAGVYRMVFTALAVCINLAGGQAALAFRLPLCLDSTGSILTGLCLGPFYGLVPGLLGGLVLGMTTDIYSLYFAPAGMATGFMAGLLAERLPDLLERGKKSGFFLAAAFITVPGTLAGALISAKLFGGITSSGSTIFVQLLSHTPLGMTASVFLVQVMTDYGDRILGLFLAVSAMRALPGDLKRGLAREGAGRKREGRKTEK